MSSFDNLTNDLDERRSHGLYRRRRTVTSPQGRLIQVDGKELLNFCSNDYLGLAGDERVRAAFKAGADQWGVGSGASHLVNGHTTAHHELEEALAEFTGRPRALLYSSGYAANVGTINGLLGKGDHVIQDRLNHASLLDGGLLSGARFQRYQHRDANDLDKKLAKTGDGRTLVVSDGTFSMDGTTCDIAATAKVAANHGAWLMIDEAHSLGVLGNDGCGLVDPATFSTNDVPVLIGTLGKAFGTMGGFVAGSDELVETLIQESRTYIYTTALPAAVATATLASLQIVREEQWRRDRLTELVSRFRAGAQELGLELMDSNTPIQPVVLGDSHAALAASNALEEQGLLITAIRPPTVPNDSARLRITFTADHTDADVDQLLDALATAIGNTAK